MNGLKIALHITVGTCALLWSSAWILAQTNPGNPANGQALYERHCLRCHGKALDGTGPDAGTLKVPPANFHSYSSRVKDDFELWLTIRQGRMFTEMHSWNETLADDQIKDVVAYIRTMAPHVKP